MQTLPVFLDVKGRRCLLVGDGDSAQRKRFLLERAGADIVSVPESAFDESLLQDAALVIVASDDEALAASISASAKSKNIPINVVDKPALCTFIFPAIVERGAVTVAVSSNGTAPVLTRLLRARIEALLPSSLGELAQQVGSFRQQVSQKISDAKQRLRFWDGLLQRYLISANSDVLSQKTIDFDRQLEQFVCAGKVRGRVAIVGSGTGDPDLLTFKTLRVLQACDGVLLDAGVNPDIAQLARRDAQQYTVQSHDDVFSLLRDAVKNTQYLVYLVPGDPLSLRDMSALLMRLQAENISFEVVPGVIDQAGVDFHAV
jgi:uroporphyrin-III C-methyltransferase/precorrin-2 dehydrogenase/sirohydrochlorin ferrochelatase